MDNQQFILSFQNNINPLISLKNLLLELSNHTNKHISKTAQDVISLIIGYTKNRDYINSILLETSYNEVPKRCVSILTKYDEQNNILLAFIDKDSVSIYIKSKKVYIEDICK